MAKSWPFGLRALAAAISGGSIVSLGRLRKHIRNSAASSRPKPGNPSRTAECVLALFGDGLQFLKGTGFRVGGKSAVDRLQITRREDRLEQARLP